jgi:biotin carboxyl carrier protein
MAKKLSLTVGLEQRELAIQEHADGSFTMAVDGVEHSVSLSRVGQGALHRLEVDGVRTEVWVSRGKTGLDVFVGADAHAVQIHRAAGRAADAVDHSGEVRAPMTGNVTEVLVQAGDAVQKGDPLLVIVAMKMNNEIKAPADGVVETVHVSTQESVNQGDLLITLESQDEE